MRASFVKEGVMTLTEPVVKLSQTTVRSGKTKPWEQQRGENALWYARFLRYVALGPSRSISLVAKGRRNAYPVPAHWPVVSVQNNWRERAQAFDEAARKDPALITSFNTTLGWFAKNADQPNERKLMEDLRYTLPEEDDNGETYSPTDTPTN